MHAKTETRIKRLIAAAIAAVLALAVAFAVHAANDIAVLEQKTTEDSIILYFQYEGPVSSAEAQIGTEAASVELTDEDDFSIITWLLVDNSVSVPNSDLMRAKELMTHLVAGRRPNERFYLCTFADSLQPIVEESRNYTELKERIDAITGVDQETYLTDVLNELLDIERSRKDTDFIRIIVFSDGVDNNPEGITREELTARLDRESLPIYTFGCKSGNNDQALKEMYAFSRQTNAESWTLTDIDNLLETADVLSGSAIPKRAVISIPEDMRDGSTKGVRLTLDGENTAAAQVLMPFVSIAETERPAPTSSPAPTPENAPVSSVETEGSAQTFLGTISNFVQEHMIWLIVGAAVVLLMVIILIITKTTKKRAAKRNETQKNANKNVEAVRAMGKTDMLNPGGSSANGTMLLVDDGNNLALTLTLTDLTHPERYFEIPLHSPVTIGRDASNRIVLDYERSVSGRHCEIYNDNNTVMVRDLHSSNGTLIDGTRVEETAELANGSMLKLGRLEFKVGIK